MNSTSPSQKETALVTGGSGTIGSAIVCALAREGYRVAFTYNKNQASADALVEELGSKDVRSYQLDLLDREAVKALPKQIESDLGPIRVLINNAGTAQVLPFAMIEEEDWDTTLDTNLKSMFLMTKAVLRGMIRAKAGRIVNMSSLAGLRVLEVPVHYATAKSAVVGFTLALAREVGRYGIRVNAVAPGMIEGGVSRNIPEAQQDDYMRFCALSRKGQPEEVADTVVFLASEKSAYINAQVIQIDGGV